MIGAYRSIYKLYPVPLYFGLKIISGIALIKVSAFSLPADGFAIFFQFLLLGALFNMVSVGGVQNGLIRQIAAHGDSPKNGSAGNAAIIIWAASFVLFCIPAIFLRGSISELLTGTRDGSWAVPIVTLASFLAGPGQILCGILTGKGCAQRSLLAQSGGVLTGTVSAIIYLTAGQPYAAAIAFYIGMLVTGPIAWALKGTLPLAFGFDIKLDLIKARILLGYSAAFVTVAAVTAFSLFGMRYYYQIYFDIEALGYWMVAQRISDTTTQFIGLFMAQIFLPSYTSEASYSAQRSVIIKSWLIVTAVMTLFLILFVVAPEIIIHWFLSDKYLPAKFIIMTYMAGDVLRVTVSLANHIAFARGNLKIYLSIEVVAILMFATIMLYFTNKGNEWAPIIGYFASYALLATILFSYIAISLLVKKRSF